ncbi:DUF1501 domain-containing protein [Marinomonas mediterranea]|jgi:Uncharacterized protein conserved in bacteria|uniref:DUF1501 domain-containing protein n=1 Tax=Marinomonas mediterranea (strain ATCC 700492 / JCM 21426 / NBRC 103028 / MMB-1) TaxID=717774 RepID=F2JXE4_MARM1|nr:DUF1501 domain-containing protein [Marinomonas mediterranea]ADZ91844.1 hypothetical protein Marme_2612 [Marinomonas mediterranea MMB-1]WCN13880.1 DUF1501 domain-containing protein [Marinomonas mediterranea]WCN17936.1 DUF1501 domain-containing protein [Marinomonas mediterranea MMB-1]
MNISRRSLLKSASLGASLPLISSNVFSKLSTDNVSVVEIFLYGGASSAIAEAEFIQSQGISGYSGITLTDNGFWEESGGENLETLLSANRLSLFSIMPWHNSKAHGFCQDYNVLGQAENLPSGTQLIAIGSGGKSLVGRKTGYISTDGELTNPFDKGDLADTITSLYSNLGSSEHQALQLAASSLNSAQTIRDQYANTYESDIGLEILSVLSYIQASDSTVYASIPFGGWDMHSNAFNNYRPKMSNLTAALVAANNQIEDQGKPIVILLRGDFGRNYYINNSNGWDHGDHQIGLLVGGAGSISHIGKSYASALQSDSNTRVYTKPDGSFTTLDPLEVRAFVLETLGVDLNQSISLVQSNTYLGALDFASTTSTTIEEMRSNLNSYTSL